LAREAAASGADLALVLGGDGTVNEAANGLANSDVPLAVLPAGTANVLAHELRLSSRLGRALHRLPHYHAKRIALGRLDIW
jgi:diacylglycerol kinase (ATP)